MNDSCECEIRFNNFNFVIKYFMKQYNDFLKMKRKNINTQQQYKKFESLYSKLNQMIKSFPDKAKECITYMKECSVDHKSNIEEINSKLEKISVLSERIDEYFKNIVKDIPEDLNEESDEEDQKDEKDEKSNKINDKNPEEEEIDDSVYEKIDIKKTMRNDKKNIEIMMNLLENQELKAKRDEEKREIIKIKNILEGAANMIDVELNKNNEQIDSIEENVENGLDQVQKGNDDELEKAAISAVKRRRLAYQGGLAVAFCAVGTVVPGIGNVIGAALGGIIGYGLYRIDKHRLNKVLENKHKIRNDDDN